MSKFIDDNLAVAEDSANEQVKKISAEDLLKRM